MQFAIKTSRVSREGRANRTDSNNRRSWQGDRNRKEFIKDVCITYAVTYQLLPQYYTAPRSTMMRARRVGNNRDYSSNRRPARHQTVLRTDYRGFVFKRRAQRQEGAYGNRADCRRNSVHSQRVFTWSSRDQRLIKIGNVSGTTYARRRRNLRRNIYRGIRRTNRMSRPSIVQVKENAGARYRSRGSSL